MADPALGAASSPSRNLPRSAARSNERDRAPRILSENAPDTDGGKSMPVQVECLAWAFPMCRPRSRLGLNRIAGTRPQESRLTRQRDPSHRRRGQPCHPFTQWWQRPDEQAAGKDRGSAPQERRMYPENNPRDTLPIMWFTDEQADSTPINVIAAIIAVDRRPLVRGTVAFTGAVTPAGGITALDQGVVDQIRDLTIAEYRLGSDREKTTRFSMRGRRRRPTGRLHAVDLDGQALCGAKVDFLWEESPWMSPPLTGMPTPSAFFWPPASLIRHCPEERPMGRVCRATRCGGTPVGCVVRGPGGPIPSAGGRPGGHRFPAVSAAGPDTRTPLPAMRREADRTTIERVAELGLANAVLAWLAWPGGSGAASGSAGSPGPASSGNCRPGEWFRAGCRYPGKDCPAWTTPAGRAPMRGCGWHRRCCMSPAWRW